MYRMERSLNQLLIQLERQRYIRESENDDEEIEDDSQSSSEELVGFQFSRQQDFFKAKLNVQLNTAFVEDVHVQQLILNYFLENGMTDSALKFAQESGLQFTARQNDFNSLLQKINTLLEQRKIEEVIQIVYTEKKEVFEKNPSLVFNLYCLIFLETENDQQKDLQIIMGKLLKIIQQINSNTGREILVEKLEEVVGAKYTSNFTPQFLNDTINDLNKGIVALQTAELNKLFKLKIFMEKFYKEHLNFVIQKNSQNKYDIKIDCVQFNLKKQKLN